MMNRFKECREKTSYTQKQVAVILGVKPPQISKWESGTGNPSRENCIKLAKLYGVSTDYLLGISDDSTPIVNNDPWDVEAAFADMMQDEKFRVLARGMAKMSPEKRENLLSGFLMMFRSDFDEEGNKKE